MKKFFTAFLLCSAVLLGTIATTSTANAQVSIGVRINSGPHYYHPYYRHYYRPGYVWVNGYYQPAPYYAPAYYAPPAYYPPPYYEPYYAPSYGTVWISGSWYSGPRGRYWVGGHWGHRGRR